MKRALLHGFLGDPSVWDGVARDGHEHIAAREPHIQGDIALALPGHLEGDRVRPTWAENLDVIAARVHGCDVAIGYSLGARIALGLLANGAVSRVVLISVNPGIDDAWGRDAAERETRAHDPGGRDMDERDTGERDARRAHDRVWAMRFRTEPLADVLDAWEAQPLFATQARVAPDILAARRERRLALDPQQIARSLEAMGLAEMPDYRAFVDARCTLIAGADDAKYLAIARSLNAPLHVIDHCGHDPLLEQPAALAKVLASIA